MKRQLFIFAGLLFPLMAFGDTLIMKDGSRVAGRFNSSNGQVVNFTDVNGNRQIVNTGDIRELRFGPDEVQARNANRAPMYQNGNPGQVVGVTGLAASLDRLEGDLRMTVDNSQLQENQRRSLRDSREMLRHAMQVSQSGQIPDRTAVRLALDNIRAAVNDTSVRPEDRNLVLNDLDQTRSMFPGMNEDQPARGRNY